MKKNLPPDQELLDQKTELQAGIDEVLQRSRKTMRVTVRDKLRLFNDELIRFKDSGISYKIIRNLLKEKLGLKVSEQTLREHCQQELGFVKRGSKKPSQLSMTRTKPQAFAPASDRTNTVSAEYITKQATHKKDETLNSQRSVRLSAQDITQATPQTTAIPSPIKQNSLSEQITRQTESMLNRLEDY